MEETRLRFSGLEWFPTPEKKIDIHIGGAGGIGSWTAFFLARIGYNIVIYDVDTVETHNLAGQLFSKNDIGARKVSAVNNLVHNFCDTSLTVYSSFIQNHAIFNPYMISAFDNMEARKAMLEKFENYLDNRESQISRIMEEEGGIVPEDKYCISDMPLFIDGRMEAEQIQIFCVTPDRIERYKETLFEDSSVEDAPCSFKQTSHTASMMGSLITTLFTNHITNLKLGEKIREVPFRTDFYSPFLNFETQE